MSLHSFKKFIKHLLGARYVLGTCDIAMRHFVYVDHLSQNLQPFLPLFKGEMSQ